MFTYLLHLTAAYLISDYLTNQGQAAIGYLLGVALVAIAVIYEINKQTKKQGSLK